MLDDSGKTALGDPDPFEVTMIASPVMLKRVLTAQPPRQSKVTNPRADRREAGFKAWLRRSQTGLTIAGVITLSILLSALPLPAVLQPFPLLRSAPGTTVLATLLPGAATDPQTNVTAAEDPTLKIPEVEDRELLPVEEVLAPLGGADSKPIASLEQLLTDVGGHHLKMEQFCRERGEQARCQEHALAPFFKAADELKAGTRKAPLRVVHFGDSLIASDLITETIRERLQKRHGSGGRGFLWVDRPTRGAGRKVRTGEASEGWVIGKLTDRYLPTLPVGISGVVFSTDGVQTTRFNTAGAGSAEVFFIAQPSGGTLELQADGQPSTRVSTLGDVIAPSSTVVPLPPSTKTLSLSSTKTGPVAVYGISLETPEPGVIYDAFGLPGGTAEVTLRADALTFKTQLTARDPAMVVVMLGGNEALELSRKRLSAEQAKEHFEKLVTRIREAVPNAACLLVGPMDAGVQSMGGKKTTRGGSREITHQIRAVAEANGCAYWDMQLAMGGPGSFARWLEKGLLNADLVHPITRGGQLLGHLFDVALARARPQALGEAAKAQPSPTGGRRLVDGGALRGYSRPKKRLPLVEKTVPTNDSPGLVDGPGALRRTFQKLDRLRSNKGERLGIVQLGASHTASHHFSDEMRSQLAAQFKGAGRGFIAAGKPSDRLATAGVRRALNGDWKVSDAMNPTAETPPGTIWGLTGIRAEGQAGASAQFEFCIGCPPSRMRSTVQVYYLAEPSMGQLDIFIEGKKVATLPEFTPHGASAQVRTFYTSKPARKVRLEVVGPRPATVFGVSAELNSPGIVYDALGLPGSTVWTVTSYDQDALAHQLKARRPDLYVLFYGTNESGLWDLDVAQMKTRYQTLFATLRKAAPQAECLIIGPTDRMSPTRDGGWVEAASEDKVVAGMREVGREHACAFWSARAAMGGKGAIAEWMSKVPPLALPDRVHLTPRGYQTLADALLKDVLNASGTLARTDLGPD